MFIPLLVIAQPSAGEKIDKEMGHVSQHLDEEISFAHAQAHELSHQHAVCIHLLFFP